MDSVRPRLRPGEFRPQLAWRIFGNVQDTPSRDCLSAPPRSTRATRAHPAFLSGNAPVQSTTPFGFFRPFVAHGPYPPRRLRSLTPSWRPEPLTGWRCPRPRIKLNSFVTKHGRALSPSQLQRDREFDVLQKIFSACGSRLGSPFAANAQNGPLCSRLCSR